MTPILTLKLWTPPEFNSDLQHIVQVVENQLEPGEFPTVQLVGKLVVISMWQDTIHLEDDPMRPHTPP